LNVSVLNFIGMRLSLRSEPFCIRNALRDVGEN
jgi:hypothetical protein